MQPVYVAYLCAFLFWWALASGSLAWLMIHRLVGGRWGNLLHPAFVAACRTMPLLFLLFVPILFGMGVLYPWTEPQAQSPLLAHRASYLNPLAFGTRSVACFVLWSALAWYLTRRDHPLSRGLCALGLLVHAVSVTFAGIDWVMSLETHWYSSIFGLLVAVGQLLAALALGVVTLAVRARRPPHPVVPDLADRFNDLGNLLLVMVLTWAYLAFMQFLIVWMGNLPDDNTWYVRRISGDWHALAVILLAGQFVVPFVLLLWRGAKRSATWLGAIALGLLLAYLAGLYWLVLPAFTFEGGILRWQAPVMLLVIGGIWLVVFCNGLRRHVSKSPPLG